MKENFKQQRLICVVVDLGFCNNFFGTKENADSLKSNTEGVHCGK